ncbi:MAG: hypothetical protein KDB14_11245 [Planctomycetales bacterium]|nr:hypothetical protein [Planctomycetales bacterium]
MTIDPTVRHHIDEVVKKFVDEGRLFTAFEVSLAVKDRGVRERHRNMRSPIHESVAEHAGNDYTRTLLDVGAPAQAWVYHRLVDNPHEYEPMERGDTQSGPPPSTDPTASPRSASGPAPAAPRNPRPLNDYASSSPATASDGAYGTDYEGKLVIPYDVLVGIGLGMGDTVDIACDADSQQLLVWRRSSANAQSADSSAVVDDDGKLRITADQLRAADLDGMQCYRVIGRGDMLTIRDFS